MVRAVVLFTVLLGCAVYCGAVCNAVYEWGLSDEDKRIIVDAHNSIREKIARGDLKGQPKGKDFKYMKYDEAIAKSAQDISNTCVFEHVAVHDPRWSVGQNLYMSMSTAPNKGANWTEAVQSWIDEYKVYIYGSGFSTSTGHYTQVVWANSEFVGCGYTFFKANDRYPYHKMYTCNYGPAATSGKRVAKEMARRVEVVVSRMSDEEDTIIAAAACVIIASHCTRGPRRYEVRPSFKARNRYSGSDMIADLRDDDVDPLRCDGSVKNFLRMTSSDFEYLISMIGHKIKKRDRNYRKAVPVQEKLAVTLRSLATGDSYTSLG